MVVFGYAIGLMAANFAVEYFETGQPALLYIVPLTLGPALYRSFKAGSLPELWRGLPRMKTIAQPFDRAEQEGNPPPHTHTPTLPFSRVRDNYSSSYT